MMFHPLRSVPPSPTPLARLPPLGRARIPPPSPTRRAQVGPAATRVATDPPPRLTARASHGLLASAYSAHRRDSLHSPLARLPLLAAARARAAAPPSLPARRVHGPAAPLSLPARRAHGPTAPPRAHQALSSRGTTNMRRLRAGASQLAPPLTPPPPSGGPIELPS